MISKLALATLLALASTDTKKVPLTETQVLKFQVFDLREKLIEKELQAVRAEKLELAKAVCVTAKIDMAVCSIDLNSKTIVQLSVPVSTKAP